MLFQYYFFVSWEAIDLPSIGQEHLRVEKWLKNYWLLNYKIEVDIFQAASTPKRARACCHENWIKFLGI